MAKSDHRKWLERMARESQRETLRKLRSAIRDARARKRLAKGAARSLCRSAKQAVRDWARAERDRMREERRSFKARKSARSEHAVSSCAAARAEAEASGDAAIIGARAALQGEQRSRQVARAWKGKARSTVAERRAESDDEVRRNLDPDELVIFEAIKARLKPTGRMSRTEALHHWMHDHGSDVARLLERHHAAELDRLIASEAKERARTWRGATDETLRDSIRASLAPVPF